MTWRTGRLAAGLLLFIWLATANSGGYRYGVSDQAFYAAAVVKALDPTLFPRDTPLLETQSRLMWADEIVAGLVRFTGASMPGLYFVLYLAGLAGLAAAALAFTRAAGFSPWAAALCLTLLTFRHRIAKTGANSLEGYMHPRMLAFACGIAALAAALRGRVGWALVAGVAAAIWHPTTAFWFAIVVGVSALGHARWRPVVLAGSVATLLVAIWALTAGPMASRLMTMDPAWLAVLAEKDYLFPTEWPAYAWVTNLLYPVVIVLIYRRRRLRAAAVPGEGAFVAGLLALFAVFLVTVPLTAMRIALAVQSQATRAFWVLDFVCAAYLAWWLITDVARTPRLRAAVVALVVAASIGRGVFLVNGPGSDRALVTIGWPASSWMEAMHWLREQPSPWQVLADPGHAWKYGPSVRLAAEKDVVLELGKDAALAMYDRDIAMRVADRAAALSAYPALRTDELWRLDARYSVDVAIMDASTSHPLPEL